MLKKSVDRLVNRFLDRPIGNSLDKLMYKPAIASMSKPLCGFNYEFNYLESNGLLSKATNNICVKNNSINSSSINRYASIRNSIKRSSYILLSMVGIGISLSVSAPSGNSYVPYPSFAQQADSLQNNQESSGTYQNSNFGSFNNSIVVSPFGTPFAIRSKEVILLDVYKSEDTLPKAEGGICGFFQTVLTGLPAQLMPSKMYELEMPNINKSVIDSRIHEHTEIKYDFLERLHDKELSDTFLLANVVECLGRLIKEGKSLISDPILTSILGGNMFGIRNFTEAMIRSMKEDPGIIGQLRDRLSSTDSLSGDSLVKKLSLDINDYQKRVQKMRSVLNVWRTVKDSMNSGMTRPALDNFISLRDMLSNIPDNLFVGFDILKGYTESTCDSYSISRDMSDHTLQELCIKYKFPFPAGGVTEWMRIGDQTGSNPEKLNRAIWSAWQPKPEKLKDYMELLKNYLPGHYNVYIDLDESPQVAGYTFTAEQDSISKRIDALQKNKADYQGSLYELSNNPDSQNLFARGAFFNHDFSSSLFDEYIATQFNRIICGQIGEVQRHCMTAYLVMLCKMFKIDIPNASSGDEIDAVLTGLGKTINEVLSELYNTPESILSLRNQAAKSKLKNAWYCGCLMLCTEYKELLKRMKGTKFKRHISDNSAPYNSLLRRKWFKQLVDWHASNSKDSVKNLSAYLLSVVYRDVINSGLDILIEAKNGSDKGEVMGRIDQYFNPSSPDAFKRIIIIDSKILDSEIKYNILHNLWDLCKKLEHIGKSLYKGRHIVLSDLIVGNFDKDTPQAFPDALKAIDDYEQGETINILDAAGGALPPGSTHESPMSSMTNHPLDYTRKRGSSVKINTNNNDDDDFLGKSVRDFNQSINDVSSIPLVRQRRNTMMGTASPYSPALYQTQNSPTTKNVRPNTPFVNGSFGNTSFANAVSINNHSINSDHSDISGGIDSAAVSSAISSGGYNTPQSNKTSGHYKTRSSLPSPIHTSIQQLEPQSYADSAQSNLVSSSDGSTSVRNNLLNNMGSNFIKNSVKNNLQNNLQLSVMLTDESNVSRAYPVFIAHNRELIPYTSNMQKILSGETLYVLVNKRYHVYSYSQFGNLGVNTEEGKWIDLSLASALKIPASNNSSESRDRSSPAGLISRSLAVSGGVNDDSLGTLLDSRNASGNYISGNYSNFSDDSGKKISSSNSTSGNCSGVNRRADSKGKNNNKGSRLDTAAFPDPAIGSNSPFIEGFKAFEGSVRRDSEKPSAATDQIQEGIAHLNNRRFSLDKREADRIAEEEELDNAQNNSHYEAVARLMRRESNGSARKRDNPVRNDMVRSNNRNIQGRNSRGSLSRGSLKGVEGVSSINGDCPSGDSTSGDLASSGEDVLNGLVRKSSTTTQIGKQ